MRLNECREPGCRNHVTITNTACSTCRVARALETCECQNVSCDGEIVEIERHGEQRTVICSAGVACVFDVVPTEDQWRAVLARVDQQTADAAAQLERRASA